MSDIGINLFAKRIAKIRRKGRVRKLGFRIILLAMLALAVTMIGLSLWSIVVAKQNVKREADIKQARAKIESLTDLESKQVYLISKLDSFEQLLKLQEKHQVIANTVFSLLPDGTSVRDFEVNEEGVILLSGSVGNYAKLIELMERVQGNQSSSRLPITASRMKSVNFGNKGTINFDLEIVMQVKS